MIVISILNILLFTIMLTVCVCVYSVRRYFPLYFALAHPLSLSRRFFGRLNSFDCVGIVQLAGKTFEMSWREKNEWYNNSNIAKIV